MSCVRWKSLAEALEAIGEFISKFGLYDTYLMVYTYKDVQKKGRKIQKTDNLRKNQC